MRQSPLNDLGFVIVAGVLVAFATPLLLTIAAEVVTLRGIADAAADSEAASAADSADEDSNDGKEMVENPTFDSENDG